MMRFILAALVASQASAQVQFEDMSAQLERHVYDGDWVHFVGGGVAVFDCNQDGLPDFFAAGGANRASLFVNAGDFNFERRDVLEEAGTIGAYPIDLDADGFSDLAVLRVGENRFFRGNGDCSFVDATDEWGIPNADQWSTSFTAWWEQGAERPTMAVGNYVDRFDPDGPFEVCDDNAVLRPTETGYTSEALTPGFCPLSILAARDARGRQTLRISNDRHYYVSSGYEQMWDIEDRRFLGEADGWHNVSLWGMGIASRDLNGDGRDEVMLTSMGDQLLQLAMTDGTYQAAPFSSGTYAQRPHAGDDTNPSTGWHSEFGDVNNDGLADLLIAKGNVDEMGGAAMRDPNNLLLQMQDGTFKEVSVEAGVASFERTRGAAMADFDNDGRLDILFSNRRAPLEIYRNITTETGGWLKVALNGRGGNTDGIGATVAVTTSDTTQNRQVTIGGGHAGGQLLPLHFGLGDAKDAVVQVTWPDGSETTSTVAPNRLIELSQP